MEIVDAILSAKVTTVIIEISDKTICTYIVHIVHIHRYYTNTYIIILFVRTEYESEDDNDSSITVISSTDRSVWSPSKYTNYVQKVTSAYLLKKL